MKKLIFAFCLSIIFIQVGTALLLNPFFYDNNGNVDEIRVFSSVNGDNNLRSEILLKGRILNQTLAKNPNAFFQLDLFSGEPDKRPSINLKRIKVCNNEPYPPNNYRDLYLECNNSIPYTHKLFPDEKGLELRFNFSELEYLDFLIYIDYILSDIIETNGDYYIAWIRTECNSGIGCPHEDSIIRTLILPSENSIIESWNNFKIIRRIGGRWILETRGKGEAMVWYRNAQKENNEKFFWFFSGILLSILFSIILVLISPEVKILNKKTRRYNILAVIITIMLLLITIIQIKLNFSWKIIFLIDLIIVIGLITIFWYCRKD